MEFDELLRTAIVRKADDPFIKGLTKQSSYETSAEGAKAGGRGGQSYISVTKHGFVGQNKLFCNEIFKLLNQFKTQKKILRKAKWGHKVVICKGGPFKNSFRVGQYMDAFTLVNIIIG